MMDLITISKRVLERLSKLDYEKKRDFSTEQLIFPNKIQENRDIIRISEQELRLLFIEEFKKVYKNLFYSIETPTLKKYKFGKTYSDIKVDTSGQSASLDMCIFERNQNNYKRILNIEFKHKNVDIKNIAKDVLKLIHEEQSGVFILLLDNTNRGTLCNKSKSKKGVLNKLYESFNKFKGNWGNDNKSIQLIILSLKQEILIHRKICKTDLSNLKEIFFIDKGCGYIAEIKGKEWKVEYKINCNE